jgi:hypothetical protein
MKHCRKNGMQFGACGKPQEGCIPNMATTKKNYEIEFHVLGKS